MANESPLARIRLLLADQHPAYLHLLRTMVEGMGFRQNWTVRTVGEAMVIMRDLKMDMLIVDRQLGDGDGLDLVRWARSDVSPNKFIPIIMASNLANRQVVNAARDAGINEFLAKPMAPRDLFMRIAACVDRPRAFVRTKVYFGPDRRRRESPITGPDRRLIVPFRGAA